MGAKHSGQTRTVSMENNIPIGVIDVSEDVVKRLRNETLSKVENDKQQQQPQQREIQQSPTTMTIKNPDKMNTPSSYPNPMNYPQSVIYVEPTVTAVDVRRQKEAELVQNDVYWRKRLQQLEQTMNKTNSIMEKEYSDAIQDVRKRFENAPPTHQLPPCQDLKLQLIACYRINRNETLKCSDEVAAFTNCVHQNRVKKLDQERSPIQNVEQHEKVGK